MRVTKNDHAVWVATDVERIPDNHNVYINVFGTDGKDVRNSGTTIRIRYGWDGMQEAPLTVALDKPLNEAGCNIPIFPGQVLWVEVEDEFNRVSDRVSGLSMYGIGSYLVHFEKISDQQP